MGGERRSARLAGRALGATPRAACRIQDDAYTRAGSAAPRRPGHRAGHRRERSDHRARRQRVARTASRDSAGAPTWRTGSAVSSERLDSSVPPGAGRTPAAINASSTASSDSLTLGSSPYMGTVGTDAMSRYDLLRDSGRRYRRAFDAVPRQRLGDEAAGLHLFDEGRQARCRCRAAPLGRAHRLLDHQEAVGQQA